MRKIPLIILVSLLFLVGCAMADQAVPFAPLGNVTGNYTLSQGNDIMEINTNMPLSSSDVVYSEVLWYIIILIGVAFLVLAAVFVARSDNVPSIAILMCGVITAGVEAAAAYMTPLVGYAQVFSQVIPTVAANGAYILNSSNTIYINHVIVYTEGIFAAYACGGLAIAGGVVATAGALSFWGVFQRKGLAQAQKGNYLETDIQGQDPTAETFNWREREPRK